MTAPAIEIVPAGQIQAEDVKKATHTATYDVICPRCGPVASRVMYPTAARERADHLCDPAKVRRNRARPLQDAVDRAEQAS